MKNKIVQSAVVFTVLILILSASLLASQRAVNTETSVGEQLVQLNEIRKLVDNQENTAVIDEKIAVLEASLQSNSDTDYSDASDICIYTGVSIAFIVIVFSYIYFSVLRPFEKMQNYAEEIAKGNFELPLNYDRSNYFGKFTWSFDNMRKEIINARSCEREAVENNKTVIATLSHDIKTPIASIRAYAEGLEANMDTTAEKREKYIKVIMRKCDEVSKLTNDLFLHSLSDLDMLRIIPERFEICSFTEKTVADISAGKNNIKFIKPKFTANVYADKKRLTQITENLINNAEKYAKTQIDIWLEPKGDNAEIHFRDYGDGIPDDDMPFIFDKFYRGKNSFGEQGSGLGLYIVKYITEHMGGNVFLYNHNDGLEAIVSIALTESSLNSGEHDPSVRRCR